MVCFRARPAGWVCLKVQIAHGADDEADAGGAMGRRLSSQRLRVSSVIAEARWRSAAASWPVPSAHGRASRPRSSCRPPLPRQAFGVGLDLFLFPCLWRATSCLYFSAVSPLVSVIEARRGSACCSWPGSSSTGWGRVFWIATSFLKSRAAFCEVAAHVAEDGADRRDDGGEHSQLGGEVVAAVVGDMFDFVVVRAVDVKTVTGHRETPAGKKGVILARVSAARFHCPARCPGQDLRWQGRDPPRLVTRRAAG